MIEQSNESRTAELEAFIRAEQIDLWNDLDEALRRALGPWSIGAANVAQRIVRSASFVGATEYGSVPWPLVAGDVYRTILDIAGLPVALPDADEWERVDRLMTQGCLSSRRAHLLELGLTVEKIRADAAWIREGLIPDEDVS